MEQDKPKRNIWKIWGIIAIILLLAGAIWYANSYYNYQKVIMFNQGYDSGLNYAQQMIKTNIFDVAKNCSVVPLGDSKDKIDLVAMECLK